MTYFLSIFIFGLYAVFSACTHTGPVQIREPALPGTIQPGPDGTTGYTINYNIADSRAYASYLKSNIALMEGNIEAAANFLRAAARRDPRSEFLKMRLAGVLLMLGRQDEAGAALSQLKIDPRQLPPELLSIYVGAVINAGNRDLARKAVLEAYKRQVLEPEQLLRWISLEENNAALADLLEFIRGLRALRSDEPMLDCIEGHLLVRSAQYDQAGEALDICLKEYDSWIPGMLERALVAELTGNDAKAEQLYKQVLIAQPGQALAIWRLRTLAEPKSERKEARRDLEKLLLEVRYEAALQLASQALGDDDLQRAEVIINDLPKELKARPRVQILLGAIEESRGNLALALKYYWSALQSDEPQIRRIAALQWVRALRLQKPDVWLSIAQSKYKNFIDASLALAIGMGMAEQDVSAAINYLDERISAHPQDAELRYRLGVLLEQQGHRQAALEQMEQVIAIDDRHADALNFVGYSLAETNQQLERAEKLIRAALELKPQAGYIMDSLGWVLFQRGKPAEAIPWLEKALEKEGPDPVILEHLGDAYARVGRSEDARAAYREALRIVEDLREAKRLRDKILNTR